MESIAQKLRPVEVAPAQVLLDPNNPRYQGDDPTFVQVPFSEIGSPEIQALALKRILAERFGVRKLADSMAQVGYLPIDRLVVTRFSDGRFMVIEGNRRIAALKLILDGKVKSHLPRSGFERVPGLLLDEPPEDAIVEQWLIQGTRHVGGVKPWGPYQKARAIQVLQRDRGMSDREVAAALGLSLQDVRKSYASLAAFEELQASPTFGSRSSTENFSYFEELHKRPTLRDYFRWNARQMRFEDPRLRDLLFARIVGSPDGAGRIPMAIDMRRVPDIIEVKEARAAFEDASQPFEKAVYIAELRNTQASLKATLLAGNSLLRGLLAKRFVPDDEERGLLKQTVELATKALKRS